MAALGPAHDGDFHASLVLTVVPNGGLTFAQWQAHSDRLLPVRLRDYELVDLKKCRVAGVPGGQRLSRHRTVEGHLLLLHQWFCAPSGVGVTLSATCAISSYVEVEAHARDAAAGLHLPGGW